METKQTLRDYRAGLKKTVLNVPAVVPQAMMDEDYDTQRMKYLARWEREEEAVTVVAPVGYPEFLGWDMPEAKTVKTVVPEELR